MNFINSILKQSKPKKCKNCKKDFIPYRSTDKACSIDCAIQLAKDKSWQKEKKALKEKSRTRTEWLNLLQVVFNTYIRKRDLGQKCISCNANVINGHASHFFSVGSYPNLRFNEDNVFLSCIECNLHKHGNTAEYAIRLPNRIGIERFNKLIEEKDKPLKLTLEEIKELISTYKEKIKQLKNKTT